MATTLVQGILDLTSAIGAETKSIRADSMGDRAPVFNLSPGATTAALTSTGPRTVRVALTAATTFTLTAGVAGFSYTQTVVLVQDTTGSRTVTWPTLLKWDKGVKPTLTTTPNALDIVSLFWTGSEWVGSLIISNIGSDAGTTTPPATTTLLVDTFTGTNGAAPAATWTRALATDPATGQASGRYPTGGTVTIQNNGMRLNTGSTTVWTGTTTVFLGDRNTPQGSASLVPIGPHAEYTFDYALGNLNEQYPVIGIRVREPDTWSSGGGAGLFKTGYNLMLSTNGTTTGTISVIRGYDTATVATIPSVTISTAMKMRILVSGSRLAIRIWAAAASEPTTWLYDNATIISDQSDGSIGFQVSNGPAAEAKTLTIDNFTATAPTLGIGTVVPAPTQTYTGFSPFYVENFDTVAPAGSGASSFLNMYSNTIQPYDESPPTYAQRVLLSAHDGVLDVAMDGVNGTAFVFGSAANANNRIGGRFSMRAKAIGAWGNGPAVMIWPSATSTGPWVDGEIDFPESVSGPGGYQGFQDPPWIHHHTMNTDHPFDQQAAQDVNLLVSWRDWHVYSAEWYPPGKGPTPTTGSIIYYVDEVEVYRTQTDIPKTVHRYMAQVGAYGSPGHMYIDWARIDTVN